jgi:hypothetical protein
LFIVTAVASGLSATGFSTVPSAATNLPLAIISQLTSRANVAGKTATFHCPLAISCFRPLCLTHQQNRRRAFALRLCQRRSRF